MAASCSDQAGDKIGGWVVGHGFSRSFFFGVVVGTNSVGVAAEGSPEIARYAAQAEYTGAGLGG